MQTLTENLKSKDELIAASDLEAPIWEAAVDFCSDHLRHFGCYPAYFFYEDPASGEIVFETSEVLDILTEDDKDFIEADAREQAIKDARREWEELGKVTANHDGEISYPFKHFPKGTDVHDIWKWFEEAFYQVSVARDLMRVA